MQYAITLVVLLGTYSTIHAQILTILDQDSRQPLEFATLTSEQIGIYATTDEAGRADISFFKGAQKIEIRTIGYQTAIKSYADLEKLEFTLLLHSGISLDQVVVSATRWRQRSRDIPAKISSVTAREVAMQNPQTAADLLGISGSVFIQKSQQGGGSPMIRGFSTNRLLYAVDGVRMNTAIFRSGNIQNVISLDPFAIQSAEVLFGPGSVIYGSDAIGGVMSFQTLSPHFSTTDKPLIKGKALARYSSANEEKTAHFDVKAGWKRWALVTSFSSNDFGDLRMGRHGPDEYLRPFYVQRINGQDLIVENEDPLLQRPSGYTQINMMQKVRFMPHENWDIQYGFHYSETSSYARYDRHIRYRSNGAPRYGEWSYGPQIWLMNNFSVSHNGANQAYDQMTLRLAQQGFEESRISRDINQSERLTRIEKVNALSANLDFQKMLGSRHNLFYGLEVVQNAVTSRGVDEDISTGEKKAGPARYPLSTWASYAAYLSDQFKVSEKFLVQAGVRYNRYLLDAEFDNTFYPFPFTEANINSGALTGSLGFVFKPTGKWALSLNASSGFRAPNVDDVGKVFDSEPGAVVVPNPGLKAEQAYNLEVGLAKIIGESIKVDFSAYYTLLENAMVRRNFTLNDQDSIWYDGELSQVQAIQNAALARVYGLQAGFEIKLPQGFSFSTDFNYQKGEEELDDGTKSPSRHAPPWFGGARLSWTSSKLSLQFYAVYSGAVTFDQLPQEERGKPELYALDADGNPWSPAWYTLNFKAMHQLTDHFSVSAGLENITDQRYRTYSSGLAAAGRNFILSFRAHF